MSKAHKMKFNQKLCSLLKLLVFGFQIFMLTAMDQDECELHAPITMHDFCCDIHDENNEFMDCQIEWNNKVRQDTDEQEMLYNFCVSECVYNKTNYIGTDRKSLRMKVIKHHLSELHGDVQSEEQLYKTYERCAGHAQEMLNHKPVQKLATSLAKQACHPYPGLVFECVSNDMILNCPPDKFHNTAQCEHARDYLKMCMKH